jgi:exodeoxyribonuclease V alpha subunit
MALIKGINLSDEQFNAIENIIQSSCSVLTGGAGVGKSTTVRLLVEMLMSHGTKISMAAPTGRAAQRLQEVTSQEVVTIHRLLKWSPEDHAFVHNEENQLPTDFVIVDESSMIDVFIFRDLLKALKSDTQILFIGDPNQLPSVGAGKVLYDVIELKLAPVFALTKTFRQDEDSLIILNANKVISGNPISKFNFIEDSSLLGKKDCFFIPSLVLDQSQMNVIKRMNNLIRANIELISQNYKDTRDIHFNWNENRFKTLTNESSREEKILFLKSLVGKMTKGHSLVQSWGSLELIEELILRILPTYYKIKDTQILCPMRKGSLGTTNLNKILQKILNPLDNTKTEFKIDKDNLFREGDKVIQTRNNYDLGIYNGDIGYITYITPSDSIGTDSGYKKNLKIKVKFPLVDEEVTLNRDNLGDLELAYAITIHKSQGSEFPAVIIPLSYEMKNMLNQNLLYTAITRAKKIVILTGHNLALEEGYKNKQQDLRQSILSILK